MGISLGPWKSDAHITVDQNPCERVPPSAESHTPDATLRLRGRHQQRPVFPTEATGHSLKTGVVSVPRKD